MLQTIDKIKLFVKLATSFKQRKTDSFLNRGNLERPKICTIFVLLNDFYHLFAFLNCHVFGERRSEFIFCPKKKKLCCLKTDITLLIVCTYFSK